MREAGLFRPAVVVTSQEILDDSATVIQIVPLTTTIRSFGSEVRISQDPGSGLAVDSAAQCQHIRSVSGDRVESIRGNVGASALSEIREVLSLIPDII